MTLFFVLSGFIIHYDYSEQITKYHWRGIVSFLIARFARLYPLYIGSVLLVLHAASNPAVSMPRQCRSEDIRGVSNL
jgi:peptidoglycan/LPS O-acetylase OafA/YrhL